MADLHLSRQALDVIFKLEAEALGAALSHRFGLDLPPIRRRFPTELPIADVHLEELDTVFELVDGRLLHLEFQAQYRPGDLVRFLRYAVALAAATGRQVITVVIYGGTVLHAPDHLDYGAVQYQVVNVFLGVQDGEAALERVRTLLAAGMPLTPEDRLDLVFAPLMRHEQPAVTVVREALGLAVRLPEDDQRQVVAALLGLSQRFLDEATLRGLVEDLMRTSLAEMILEQGWEKGWEKGRTEGLEEGLEKGLEEGLEKGLEEGLEKGLEKGRKEEEERSARESVRLVLEARFGPLPEDLAQRLGAVHDVAVLREVLRLAVTAPSLAEVAEQVPQQG
ncbi:MAG TPA: hypothetical protein VNL71_16455 [Chloroflexota bacterium]|nr:hypothetical protein [Chloroflexota bacterium]